MQKQYENSSSPQNNVEDKQAGDKSTEDHNGEVKDAAESMNKDSLYDGKQKIESSLSWFIESAVLSSLI